MVHHYPKRMKPITLTTEVKNLGKVLKQEKQPICRAGELTFWRP